MTIDLLVKRVRQFNNCLALAAGSMLVIGICLTIIEIILRRFGHAYGGSEEISGYIMAITTAWGLSYALTERAHVRIDLLRTKLSTFKAAVLDLIALMSLALTALFVGFQGWFVLQKTLSTGATANTAMQTPLIIPQLLWLSGWIWFAACAVMLCAVVLVRIYQRKFEDANTIAGMRIET